MTWGHDDTGRTSGHFAFGVFLVILGLLALLNNLGVIFIPSVWRLFWPVVIIWVGVNILRRNSRHHGFRQAQGDFAPAADSNAVLGMTAILGGAQHKSSSGRFSGANLTAFLGGVNLDLREAKMDGNTATIDVFAMMGGMEIVVPPDWSVESHVTPMLAGFENKTHPPKEPTQRLIIHGTVIMGGVEVKN